MGSGVPIWRRAAVLLEPLAARKGTNGVGTNGVTADFMVLERGTFLGTPVNLLLSSQKCQGVITIFPNLSKIITLAAAPSVLTPFVRNQAASTGPTCSRTAGTGRGNRTIPCSAKPRRATKEGQWVLRTHLHIRTLVFLRPACSKNPCFVLRTRSPYAIASFGVAYM